MTDKEAAALLRDMLGQEMGLPNSEDDDALRLGIEALEARGQVEVLTGAAQAFERERDEARAELARVQAMFDKCFDAHDRLTHIHAETQRELEQLKRDWTTEHLKVAKLQELLEKDIDALAVLRSVEIQLDTNAASEAVLSTIRWIVKNKIGVG